MVSATSCQSLVPLDLMKAGECASIVELHGDSSQIHRLQEMGLRAGAQIRMLKPGAPCLVALDGKRLSLRLGALLDILVAVPTA
ncbi:MAG: ferrous iron transport protein A [Pirellulaceae bacterium]|nr:ferrous iron transport protein A [Pirellulaceae bacterium]